MDPRERADAALARARARGRYVVTPDDAVSPMDAASTQQIPRAVVNALDDSNPDNTMVIAAGTAAGQQPQQPVQQQTKPLSRYTQPVAQQPTQPMATPQQPTQPMATPQQPTQPMATPQQPAGHPQTHPPTAPVPPPARNPEQVEDGQQVRDLGGLVPTVQQPGTGRSMLSRRLDGN